MSHDFTLPIPWEPSTEYEYRMFYLKVARLYHYPLCWDTIAYPTLFDALYEMRGPCTTCELEEDEVDE